MPETDGYQWMTNPNKIATEDAKQILNEKFNHFNNQLIFFGNIQCHGSMASVVQHLFETRLENSGFFPVNNVRKNRVLSNAT